MEAGIRELGTAFGFYSTLDRIARHEGITDSQALKKTYYEFYMKVIYLSHVNDYQKSLGEILKRKN